MSIDRAAFAGRRLFVGILDSHRIAGRDLEIVERIFGCCRLGLRFEFDECDICAIGNLSNVLETEESKIKIGNFRCKLSHRRENSRFFMFLHKQIKKPFFA